MASIYPFQAILYQSGQGADITPLVAPPYDVINDQLRKELAGLDLHNIVRLILPQAPDNSDAYATAASQFDDWVKNGIMAVSNTPALYVWEQEYGHHTAMFKRRALVAKVNCAPYRVGGVMGHERTHAGPREDRLRLFRATAAQFSQIFSIFNDTDNSVAAILAAATEMKPLLIARGGDGHTSRLYPLNEVSAVKRLQEIIADKTILIADGHHRYETSVAYYQERGTQGTALMTLVPDSDPGLIVLPTHRVIPLSVTAANLEVSIPPGFSAETHDQAEWPQLYDEAVDKPDRGVLVAVAPGEGKALRIQWDRDTMQSVQDSTSPRLRSDAVILHEFFLGGMPDSKHASFESSYFHRAEDAVQRAGEMHGWAFLLRPLTTAILLKIAEREEILPPKSTYFFPKFLSGFVNAYLD